MAARYFSLEEVLERVVNDDEVSDLDVESEQDMADLPSESDESNSTEAEAELSENSDDSGKFMSLFTLGMKHFSLTSSVALISISSDRNISFTNIQFWVMKIRKAIAAEIAVLALREGNLVGHKVCVHDADEDELLEELAVVVAKIEDDHEMLTLIYSGREMQEDTLPLHSLLR